MLGSTTANLAWLASQMRHFARARPLYERALDVYHQSVGDTHPMVASALVGLAKVQAESDVGDARKSLERAQQIREHSFGLESHDVADCLRARSDLELAAGDLRAAEDYAMRGLAIQQHILGPRNYWIAEHLTSLAVIEAKLGKRDAAIEFGLEAEAISRDHVRLAVRSLPESEALALVA